MAGLLERELLAHPALADEVPLLQTLDAAMAANPALPWYTEALGQPEPPDTVISTASRLTTGALFDLLTAPFLVSDDLQQQLAWVFDHWSMGADVREAALVAWDVLAEESTFRGGGPGPTAAPGLGEITGDPGYSIESEWMTRAVLAVKHGPVWLAQLTAWRKEPIDRLDRIPEEELARLASHGATVLWLVGVWERSPASRAIKRMRGAKEAIASAYSLVDYRVAIHLGGEAALDVLRARAARQGLRLCADVVPNHTGLDSRWMVERPDWFVQTQRLPFPSYRFSGANLSGDPRIEVRIEDGYWREDDAAVVFERRDVATGEVRWIYHGNDGTTMPWNDTAQLDVSLPEVRTALINTVLRLATRYGALRFDAAMALARQHVKRLWYPDPGQGGAIPSRSGQGLSDEEWARRMPGEFWSELVDAVRTQAPETLLLAEAFWLMEVDFARTYGVNRVYWSAFRDWVRDDAHGEHRIWLHDVLGREPQLLARLCLFLSNPDEVSVAVAFGTGARYLAAATLQATLPGLPLLAHGQVDGLSEQYGMEFQRPHLIDRPNPRTVAMHQKWIAPLLRLRALFGQAEGFRLFEFKSGAHGQDCVYAYTQRRGGLRALILVNASPEPRRGRIFRAVPTRTAAGLEAPTLAEALGFAVPDRVGASEGEMHQPDRVVNFTDPRTGERLTVPADSFLAEGLTLSLASWECAAFLEISEDDAPVVADRSAGILMHPTSLPGRERVGTLGKSAHAFLDWMAAAGFRCWQVLPLCAGGPGDSPYSSPASRLGDPLLVDLEDLKRRGWLTASELRRGQSRRNPQRVRFGKARRLKMPLLDAAARRLLAATDHPEHADWLMWRAAHPDVDDAVLFGVLKGQHSGKAWWQWPEEQGRPTPEQLAALRLERAEDIAAGTIVAWWFDDQWATLRTAAEALGIELVSDLPIYVALDSAEVWTEPKAFELDSDGRPIRLSGVPPDSFAADGQLWGNPLYRWDQHAADGFRWWIARFRRAREWTPVLRIDHFRGFSAYYAVPGDASHARDGTWNPGPGAALCEAIDSALGPARAIAEDLGQIDEAVHVLRAATGMLGTRVLQFGFEGDPTHDPQNIGDDVVVYTGTHDNDTTMGWWQSRTPEQRAEISERLAVKPHKKAILSALIDAALGSRAPLAVLPMQDLIGLGNEGRMNLPGTVGGNWSWRLKRLPDVETAESWRARLTRFER